MEPILIVVFFIIDFQTNVHCQGLFNGSAVSLCKQDDTVTSLQKNVYDLTNTIRNQVAEVKLLKSKLADAQRLPNVAFSVRLGREVTLLGNDTVPFTNSDVITNIGNAYNSVDSKFQCPQTGLYYFHSMICSQKTLKARGLIVRNTEANVMGFLYAEDQSNYDCGGNGVVEKLNKGDTVWIMSYQESHLDTNCFFTGVFLSK